MNRNLLDKIPKEYFIQGIIFKLKNPATLIVPGF